MVDLGTTYMGMRLATPVVPSASPLTEKLDVLHRLQAAGAGAVVLRSLFEEQIERTDMDIHEFLEQWTESCFEAQSFFPPIPETRNIADTYLEHIASARRELSIPVIASLNGASPGGWTRYAKLMEDAGADAIELNIFLIPAGPDEDAEAVEQRYADLVASVRDTISVPLAVKIGPHFSAIPAMARKLALAGADGLVLFNRFVQPDIDLETLTVTPTVRLSTSAELSLPLRWLAILRRQASISLAATSGVHTTADVLKVLLAGGDIAMMASALLQHGPEHVGTVVAGLRAWMDEHGYSSVDQLKGSLAQQSIPDPTAYERSQYMQALSSYATRIPSP
ncbi:MAG: dihydroorotate dehydrogenase-like protein [Dehalococcoidia bacterium]|nr:dihydroorotate dehydrogenase-like protein [Dehalococcoidia bacterium]